MTITNQKINVLMIGTGEYTTGYVPNQTTLSDKTAGVVALTMLDLRRRSKIQGRLAMCGVNGTKFPSIRQHMKRCIQDVYDDMGEIEEILETFPEDDVQRDVEAYKKALDGFGKGDVAFVFTPDDTHYEIGMECIKRGLHVMITKPIVQTLNHHKNLYSSSKEHEVLVGIEVHKRLDPFYTDARDRIRSGLGNFQYLYAYMSQPKHQLDTFKAWAGKSSDISYYLNSHHVDFSEWVLRGVARPVRVVGTSSTGIAKKMEGIAKETEDSITLTVQWENLNDDDGDQSLGCAVYTASWAAPKSDVHSQQRFFYMGSKGEINVDQAHRGCTVSTDEGGFGSVNPLFMKYTPSNGKFVGQGSYGVQSLERFVDACLEINDGKKSVEDYDDGSIATVGTTFQGTAILEAGRMSLDQGGRPMDIVYEDVDGRKGEEPVEIRPHDF